jgi:RNA polymerase sigma-70 factor (ECF subfamily)
MADGMSEPAGRTLVRVTAPEGPVPSEADFICAFNEMRTELLSSLYFFLNNYEDAQDAIQDAFLKCWRRRSEMTDVRNMRAWIYRVGLNSAKDLQRNAWRRKSRRLPASMPLVEKNVPSPFRSLEEQETQERLRAALLDLRPEEKEVFLLRQNGGLTYEEIAKIRHSPVGTVKTQMRAAIFKLRRVLQEKVAE